MKKEWGMELLLSLGSAGCVRGTCGVLLFDAPGSEHIGGPAFIGLRKPISGKPELFFIHPLFSSFSIPPPAFRVTFPAPAPAPSLLPLFSIRKKERNANLNRFFTRIFPSVIFRR